MSGSNPLTCQQECQQTDKCEFWTYDTSSGGIGLNCWLKTKGDYRIQNSERASGPKYCGKTKMLKLLPIPKSWFLKCFNCILEKCKTTEYGDAPQKGVECVFPMKFDGKIYNGCVPDVGGASWCSTKGMIPKMIFVIFLLLG